ncbi:MAG TPA: 2-succinyl-5-enolpyruvyl-6-hydroxy-3-cyclohexene-1-carboxylic-acid synthase [Lacunisphaera sp.]|nr:2-succinyl-5-enolpyruvyl-6-hydroxy-3-cyclohexene-1-carboxylic-acid synthase [Lacunisphaera sp.]
MSQPTSLDFRNPNSLWCGVLVETLVRLGLRQAVISPGSRSAPLTFALARHRRIEAIPVLDERSAGFLALGLAKQRHRPVALVCTSGTAAANFLPAVVEAHESGVPLLVLTADRPPELRDCHSGQSIDQQELYGGFVNLFQEMPVPAANLGKLRGLRKLLESAWKATALPMVGPVHLNCPFRDPLPPLPQAMPAEITGQAVRKVLLAGAGASSLQDRASLGAKPRRPGTEPGVIVVGPNDPASPRSFVAAVDRLARALGWPVLADALSPLRMDAAAAGPLVAHYDAILRNRKLADELQPRQVICIGGWPTSKVLREWLQRADPEVWLLTERTDNLDGLHLRTRHIRGEVEAWCRAHCGSRPLGTQGRRWLAEEKRVAAALGTALGRAKGLVEPAVVPVLSKHLPRGTPVFVASSMPVRDMEYFWPVSKGRQRIVFSRGANGIDGTLSTALGLAHGNRPAVLLTGDLALLHDTNGFLSASKLRGSLTIILINNHGGGIFEHLPVAQFDPPFEEFFATPQQVDFRSLCATYGVKHVAVTSLAQFARLVANLPRNGVRVLELRTDRKHDAAFRKRLFASVAN